MTKTITHGISVIYFDEPHKNVYAKIEPDREQAKRLSKRIFKDAMTAIAIEENLPCQTSAE